MLQIRGRSGLVATRFSISSAMREFSSDCEAAVMHLGSVGDETQHDPF